MDNMVTLRMVAESVAWEPLRRSVCIDVVLRGDDPTSIEKVREKLVAGLDIGLEMGGAWVDQGTQRSESVSYTVGLVVDAAVKV